MQRCRFSSLVVLAVAAALASFPESGWAQAASAQAAAPEIFSGKIMALSGLLQGKPTDLVVVVGRACTLDELRHYEQIVNGPDGQTKLAEALGSAYDVGAYRLGTDLGLAVKLITVQPEKGGSRRITLIGTRIPQGLEMQGQLTARDYRFVVIQLKVKQDGSGEGSYYHSAKIRFNSQHLPEVEDFQMQPEAIKNIRPEHPR